MCASPHVRTVIRTRPVTFLPVDLFCVDDEKDTIEVRSPSREEALSFRFDKVLHDVTQETVYKECVPSILQGAVDGLNGSVMAYGQTGAGKTYTMFGSSHSYASRGIIPRFISDLFALLEKQTELEASVFVSFCEIDSELLFDLLADSGLEGQTGTELQIQEDAKGGLTVRGLTVRQCSNLEDALNSYFWGANLRSVSSHGINPCSSRSHCIFTVYVHCKNNDGGGEGVKSSKIHFVDLAGCERPKKTQGDGPLLKGTAFINKSLSFLEMVVVALGEKGRDHIPYRSSRLTHLLKDTLGGNSNTCLIANIWPEKEHLEETVSTLRFSQRMMRVYSCVANKAVVNLTIDPLALSKRLEKDVARLRQELQITNSLMGRHTLSYDASSPEELEKMRKMATQFLNGEQEAIQFTSVRQVEELLQMMRSVFQEMAATIRREAAEAVSAAVSSPDSDVTGAQGANEPAGASKAKGTPATPKAGKDQNKANQQGSSQGSPQQGPKPVQKVGYEDPSVGGISLGTDPDQSEIAVADRQNGSRRAASPQSNGESVRGSGTAVPGSTRCWDRREAYSQFRETEGKELSKIIRNLSQQQAQQKQQLKAISKV
ncbi:kinesin motor domain-containing protein, putative [Eimeria necatrix]|uniref:Kinesin motor domain-containing protein, putative n=1 Tax=Eimeria necatrix TaxID=51315 RepID=U6MQI0_9EIME|nr:kinesin motor domain-containing protein, putative [Eimeria necatrix]CDJ64719.1 kinesin motor domain-containing protein, putative [Eimeria necatrix]